MAKPLLPDDLWAVIEPLLPPPPKSRAGAGGPRIPDRACLTGILFVLKTGIQWEHMPQEMGRGSGMTCWRRLRHWHEAGVWAKLHLILLERLAEADKLGWNRASVDSASVAAPKGGSYRPGSDQPGQEGHQAPHNRRWVWHAAGRGHFGFERAREPDA